MPIDFFPTILYDRRSRAGMAELADALDLGSSGQPCGFDSHYPYQARRKRHITCDELFHFIAKLIVRSFCRSSLSNRTRCAGLRLGAALRAAVFALVKISVLTVLSTWWQSSLCDHVFLCLRQKRRHPPAPLLFLFKSNPLRRASIWILIQTDSHCIFF